MPQAATHTASGSAGAHIEQRSRARMRRRTGRYMLGPPRIRRVDRRTLIGAKDRREHMRRRTGRHMPQAATHTASGRPALIFERPRDTGWHAGHVVSKGRNAVCAATPTMSRSDGAHGSPPVRGMRDAVRGRAGTCGVRRGLHNTAVGCRADTHTSSAGRRTRRPRIATSGSLARRGMQRARGCTYVARHTRP